MKKTLIALTLISASLTGFSANAVEATPEQAEIFSLALADTKAAVHISSRCLINYKVMSVYDAANSEECKAMLKSFATFTEDAAKLKELSLKNVTHPLLPEITQQMEAFLSNLREVIAIQNLYR